MTSNKTDNIVKLTPAQAHNIIEALKNMLTQKTGKQYRNLKDVQADMEVAKDGKNQTSQIETATGT